MQVQQKDTFIQSFGGINFIHEQIVQKGFHPLVLEHIGKRSAKATYSYGDITSQLFYTALIGGEVLDDNAVLKAQLQDHPSLQIASADTIEYCTQELKQPTTEMAIARRATTSWLLSNLPYRIAGTMTSTLLLLEVIPAATKRILLST